MEGGLSDKNVDIDGDINEDTDFSDLVLNYINQMLMEEDIEEKNCMFQQSDALHAAEMSFYNLLVVKHQDQDHGQVTNHGQNVDLDQVQVLNHGQNQDQDHGQVPNHGQNQDQDQDQDQVPNQDQDQDHGQYQVQVQVPSHGQNQDQDQDQDHGQLQYYGQDTVEDYLYNAPIIQDKYHDQEHGQPLNGGQDQYHCQDQDQDHGQLQNGGQDQDTAADEYLYNLPMVQDQDHGHFQNHLAAELIDSVGISSSMSGPDLTYDIRESSLLPNTLTNFDSQSTFHPPHNLFNTTTTTTTTNMVDGFLYSPVSPLSSRDTFCDNGSTMQFQNETRGKKNPYSKDIVEFGRNSKQSAVYSEAPVSSKMFDDVLLCGGPKTHPFQCDFVCKKFTSCKKGQQQQQPKGVKARAKKPKDALDLTTLLSLCAQSVSVNDQRGATDLLKRIREHASPTGDDAMQRLAHYFSDGLEARMAGSGTRIYKALVSIPTSAVDVLKAYHLFLGCFPFTKISHFISNKTIMSVAQNKTKLHIIDFGILHGFQWPCLIQQLSTRPGGPPELRITGIDFPCPGFRPTQRVEETVSRLANYAQTFGVGFRFKAIAQKWETIRIEDLELDDDETLVVNCGYRFRNLLDETVMVDSPRKKVLGLIREMKPEIFIHGVVNGSYGVPFFLTRFREALFFFSSLFDMLDATVDRLTEERMLVEKTMWGREAMNVIACEVGERIERPETYKQW